MFSTTVSTPAPSRFFHDLKKAWQRGFLVEYAVVAFLVALTVVQIVSVVGTRAS